MKNFKVLAMLSVALLHSQIFSMQIQPGEKVFVGGCSKEWNFRTPAVTVFNNTNTTLRVNIGSVPSKDKEGLVYGYKVIEPKKAACFKTGLGTGLRSGRIWVQKWNGKAWMPSGFETNIDAVTKFIAYVHTVEIRPGGSIEAAKSGVVSTVGGWFGQSQSQQKQSDFYGYHKNDYIALHGYYKPDCRALGINALSVATGALEKSFGGRKQQIRPQIITMDRGVITVDRGQTQLEQEIGSAQNQSSENKEVDPASYFDLRSR